MLITCMRVSKLCIKLLDQNICGFLHLRHNITHLLLMLYHILELSIPEQDAVITQAMKLTKILRQSFGIFKLIFEVKYINHCRT